MTTVPTHCRRWPRAAHRRRAGRRPRGAGDRVRGLVVHVGRAGRHGRARRPRWSTRPGAEVGIFLRNRPASVGLAPGGPRGRRLRGDDQPGTRPGPHPRRRRRRSTSAVLAGEPEDLAELVPDGLARPRPRRRPSANRWSSTSVAAGSTAPAAELGTARGSRCACSPAARRGRRSGSTSATACSSGSLVGAKHYESNRDETSACGAASPSSTPRWSIWAASSACCSA